MSILEEIYQMNDAELDELIDHIKNRRSELQSRRTLAFKVGDKVSWESGKRNVGRVTGTITKINKVTVNIKEDNEFGSQWRVSPSLLTKED